MSDDTQHERRRICYVLLILAAVGLGSTASADDAVELINGTRLTGQVQRTANVKVPYVVVDTGDGIRIALPEGEVRRVVNAEEMAEYRARAAAAGDDAEAHYELARWCKGQHLLSQYDHHMQRVIGIDPEHAAARAALRFVKHDGKWVPYARLQRERGMVLSKGDYALPEAVAISAAADERSLEAKRWIREVARLRGLAMRGGEAGAQALAALQAIEDPLAAEAIGKELTERGAKQPQPLRLLWVRLLGRLRTNPALAALTKTGLDESDPVIREAAYTELEKYGRRSAILTYTPLLKSSSNKMVNNAARALTFLGDETIKLQLVDALVTEHKETVGGGPGMNVGFGNGGGGLSMGGKPKVVSRPLKNPQVLAALRKLEPNVDHQYDEDAWRRYFAVQMAAYRGDLRRDR